MLIERFLQLTGIEKEYLLWVSETASRRYKVYEIDKKSGGKREISHPARSIKAIQRWLNKSVFSKFPIHESATAYKKGASIKANALAHAKANFTLRLDYKNFFPSFEADMLRQFLENRSSIYGISLNREDISFICNIVMKDGHLTIGAPSSPVITNAMMYDFDSAAYEFCAKRGLIYTRYADDIFISSRLPNQLGEAKDRIMNISSQFFGEKLIFNTPKTRFLSRKYRRIITGIVITPDYKISIGRKRKREVRTLIYKYTSGGLGPVEIWRLKGLVAFIMDVEPDFYNRLCFKYGEKVIASLMSDVRVKSKKVIGSLRRARFRILKK